MGYKYSEHTDRERKKESTRCFSWSKIKQQQKKPLEQSSKQRFII